MSKYTFQVGKSYTRRDVRHIVGLDADAKGGPWYTGYAEHDGADFIFCNVGAPGRTGHDYDNYFNGDQLIWRGKTNSHAEQPTIRRMTASGSEVHIFWRTDERAPFTYAGQAKAVEVAKETPVKVRWSFTNEPAQARRDTRSQERLPADVLEAVTPEHVWNAVQMLLNGYSDHQFAASTDYDLIAENGARLPPKAVFGIAASLALGFEVLPKHFTAGDDTISFRIMRQAGYTIVRKNDAAPSPPPELSSEDQVWAEGKGKLVTHLVKERAKGLSQAKKAQFRREHGNLFCERCGLDPVSHYKTVHAESCIEVHHNETHVRDMSESHKTTLDTLQCLCANCHRLVHRELRERESEPA